MARIFVEFSSGIGPMSRCLPILLKLKELGHAIKYFAHKECISYMGQCGFKKINIEVSTSAMKEVKYNWIDADEYWGTFGFENSEWFENELKIWLNEIIDYKPDLIISDLGVFSSVTARILNIPLVVVTQSCYHPRIPHKVQGYWMEKSPSNSTLQVINHVLQKYNAKPFCKFEEIFLGDLVLIMSFPEFDKLDENKEKQKDHTYFVGPVIWEESVNKKTRITKKAADKKNIFCYTGQIRGNGIELDFFQILEAIAKANDYRIIVSTGGKCNIPRSIDKNLTHLICVDWISMKEAYENSDLVICHGGHQSCMGLFKYGVPGLILATHTEREYNGRLVEQIGAGMCLGVDKINYQEVERCVNEILNNCKYQEVTQNYKAIIEHKYTYSVDKAVMHILSILNK